MAATLNLIGAMHVGARTVRLQFNQELKDDAARALVTNYSIAPVVGGVANPAVVYTNLSGPVKYVYIHFATDLADATAYTVTVVNLLAWNNDTLNDVTEGFTSISFVTEISDMPRYKIRDIKEETGKHKDFNVYAGYLGAELSRMGLSDDLIGGAEYGTMSGDLDDTDPGTYTWFVSEDWGIWQLATVDTDVFMYLMEGIPTAWEIPYGKVDGINKIFFLTVPMVLGTARIIVNGRVLGAEEWYASSERAIVLITAPSKGQSVIIQYEMYYGLLKIGNEILAYQVEDRATNKLRIIERANISSTREAHDSGSECVNLLACSFIQKLKFNFFVFTAFGKFLDFIGLQYNISRPASMLDRQYRRLLFNTAVGPRGIFDYVEAAIAYLYPRVRNNILVTDFRGRTVVFWDDNGFLQEEFVEGAFDMWDAGLPFVQLGGTGGFDIWYDGLPYVNLYDVVAAAFVDNPPFEVWEYWMDQVPYWEGTLGMGYASYWRTIPPATSAYLGSYFASSKSAFTAPGLWPVIVSGSQNPFFGCTPYDTWFANPDLIPPTKPKELYPFLDSGVGIVCVNVTGKNFNKTIGE